MHIFNFNRRVCIAVHHPLGFCLWFCWNFPWVRSSWQGWTLVQRLKKCSCFNFLVPVVGSAIRDNDIISEGLTYFLFKLNTVKLSKTISVTDYENNQGLYLFFVIELHGLNCFGILSNSFFIFFPFSNQFEKQFFFLYWLLSCNFEGKETNGG